jgi:hypothetical protein
MEFAMSDTEDYIKRGITALDAIEAGAETTFRHWLAVGEALQAGQTMMLFQLNMEKPRGKKWAEGFGPWLAETKFDRINKGTRSILLKIMESRETTGGNIPSVETWYTEIISPHERLIWNHPQTIWSKYNAAYGLSGRVKKSALTPMEQLQNANIELQEQLDSALQTISDMNGGNTNPHIEPRPDPDREAFDEDAALNRAMNLPADKFVQGMVELEGDKEDYPRQVMEELRRLLPGDPDVEHFDVKTTPLNQLIRMISGLSPDEINAIAKQIVNDDQDENKLTSEALAKKLEQLSKEIQANADLNMGTPPKPKRRRYRTRGEVRAEKAAAAAAAAPPDEDAPYPSWGQCSDCGRFVCVDEVSKRIINHQGGHAKRCPGSGKEYTGEIITCEQTAQGQAEKAAAAESTGDPAF